MKIKKCGRPGCDIKWTWITGNYYIRTCLKCGNKRRGYAGSPFEHVIHGRNG